MKTFPQFSTNLQSDPTTRRIWYGLATVHDFESHDGMTEERLYQQIFKTHFSQIAVIFLWTAGNLFHVAWQGNFEAWISNPVVVKPIAHAIFDPHFSASTMSAYGASEGFNTGSIRSFSGLYNLWLTIGLTTNQQLAMSSLGLLVLAALLLGAGQLSTAKLSWFRNVEARLSHHLSAVIGLGSIAWTGHLVHVALPKSRGIDVNWGNFLDVLPHPAGLSPFFAGQWATYAENPDQLSHIFGQNQGAGTALLTFHTSIDPNTQSLWLTDIAHHHLAIGVLFIVLGHFFRTSFGFGHSITSRFVDIVNNSLHCQLGFALALFGVLASLTAQHQYFFQPYVYLSKDYPTMAALYTHHQYIAATLMCGAFAHGAIFFIRDYDPVIHKDTFFSKLLDNKESIIAHLSWVSLFLGFHTLGLYVHNDVVVAFGTAEKQILIEPVFAQWVQSWGLAGFDATWDRIGPGDFLVHHAIALGLHTTTLILLKGALDARGSRLMPDKKDFGYSFPCDGPGRGGTCDISAFDAFYLAAFWALNTVGWVTFYWHWKHLCVWGNNIGQFETSSTYLMGWFRDYLWLNSSQLINGYNPFGMNSLSVWAWLFLGAHLCWATGFMFLISWRGYWQELVEVLAWAHENTPIANQFVWADKPVALSIVQARTVGLAHFAAGYVFTYGAFVLASTIGKF
jgi:photosystem I P700 chlorophyll a apoprotein A2